MLLSARPLAAGLLLVLGLAGCSTPRKRAQVRRGAFQRLSSSDQALVLHGHVRPGLSQEGLYIAWGEPDEKVPGVIDKGGVRTETWVYRQRVTLSEPQNSPDYYGPYQGVDDAPAAPSLRPGYGVGGIGNEALFRLQPHIRHLDTLRVAEFRLGEAGNPQVMTARATSGNKRTPVVPARTSKRSRR